MNLATTTAGDWVVPRLARSCSNLDILVAIVRVNRRKLMRTDPRFRRWSDKLKNSKPVGLPIRISEALTN